MDDHYNAAAQKVGGKTHRVFDGTDRTESTASRPWFAPGSGRYSMVCFAIMRNNDTKLRRRDLLQSLKAIASPVRLEILRCLREPTVDFPPQVDGDPVSDGICADFIRQRLRIAAATASRHLTLLTDSGLLIATRKKGWTFYCRDNRAIERLAKELKAEL
jgi:DNA-binding transcriptional ArsR family regulator